MEVAVVEFQAFSGNKRKFIIKELAIVANSFQCHIVFKAPFPKENLNDKSRKTNHWLEQNYHKIAWEEGDYPYKARVIRNLCKDFTTIYTRGREKAQFLRKFHTDVRELDDLLCNGNNLICSCKGTHRLACSLPQHNLEYGDSDIKCAMMAAKCRFEILYKLLNQDS